MTAGEGKNSEPSVKAGDCKRLHHDSVGTQLKCTFSSMVKGESTPAASQSLTGPGAAVSGRAQDPQTEGGPEWLFL